jgi:site-specific recombinase XerD
VVIVPASLIAELREHSHPRTFFDLTMYAMLRRLKMTAKRAGLNPDDCWLHKFRANYATTLLRAGVDIRTVAAQLGHKSLAPTMRYLALLDDSALQKRIEAVWA